MSGIWNDVVPRIDEGRCQRCAECAAQGACLVQAFRRPSPDSAPQPDADLCLGCYTCVGACAHRAVSQPRRG